MPEDMPGNQRRRNSKGTNGRSRPLWGNQYGGVWISEVQVVVQCIQLSEVWIPGVQALGLEAILCP